MGAVPPGSRNGRRPATATTSTIRAGGLEVTVPTLWNSPEDSSMGPMGIVLLGPPGAGKGTQAALLAADLGIANISTGQILRANVAAGTPLGRSAQRYMDAGDLVPDQIVTEMVFDRLGSPDCEKGYLLDGFPRNVHQAKTLDHWLEENCTPIGAAVSFEITEGELLARLTRRATEQGRSDDTAETIRHRFEVFGRSTRPLLDYYAERGMLISIDAIGPAEEITARVRSGLAARAAAAPPAIERIQLTQPAVQVAEPAVAFAPPAPA
jgi:adenylate kinase